jgi:hypothetical protein
MKHRYIIAGIYRSGSTWLYNAVRLICAQHGTVYGCFEGSYNSGNAADYHIVKAHKFKWPRGFELIDDNTTVITSIRNTFGIKESMQRLINLGKSGNYTQVERLTQYLEWLSYWNCFVKPEWNDNQFPVLKVPVQYGRIVSCPEKVIREVSEYMNLKCNEQEINIALRALKPPHEGIDPITLLHANHITQ